MPSSHDNVTDNPNATDDRVEENEASERASESVVALSIPTTALYSRPPVIPDVDAPDFDDEDLPPPNQRTPEQQEKARKRQEVYLQKRRQKKRRRIIVQRLSVIVRALFVFGVFAMAYWAIQHPFWILEPNHVTVSGCNLLSDQRLKTMVGSFANRPVYLLDPNVIERRVKSAFPLIQDVYVRRRLNPVGLDVMVTEKPTWGVVYERGGGHHVAENDEQPAPSISSKLTPLFLLHWDGSKTDLKRLGYSSQTVLDHIMAESTPLILVPDAVTPLPIQTDQLMVATVKRYHQLVGVLSPPYLEKAKLHHLDISDPANIRAYFDGFTVYLGRSNSSLVARAERLAPVISVVRRYQGQLAFVDLRWNHQLTLRKKSSKSLLKTTVPADNDAGDDPTDTSPPNDDHILTIPSDTHQSVH